MESQLRFLSRFLMAVTAGGMLVAMAAVPPALAEDDDQAASAQAGDQAAPAEATDEAAPAEEPAAPESAAAEPVVEEIVVKGFRSALEYSVGLKRQAVNNRESIVAEDIGKMPDLNLAEAIERVPAVAVQRAGGEGRQISLRGLGANFTRVTLNGMEVPASTAGLDSAGGVNRGRSFDFNVFSAELFNRIDIEKSPTAAIEEGGVAGTVELYTARPLDRRGFRANVTALGGFNDLSEKFDPRVTAIVSNTNEAGTAGFLLSAAYTGRTPYQDGFGTVRYAQPDKPYAGNNTNLSDDVVNSLWYPRLPRQDSFRHDQQRLGLTGALQLRPNDKLDIGVNWLYSHYEATANSYNSFAQFRRSGSWGYHTIIVDSVSQDATGKIADAGSFSNVALRTESRQNTDTTDFNQVTANLKYDLSDSLKLTGLVGYAKSAYSGDYFRVNIETPGTGFSYDFRDNPNVAKIHYDLDVTDPANYAILANENFLNNIVDRTNKTGRLDLEWTPGTEKKHTLKFGGIYNDRQIDSKDNRQNADRPNATLPAISKVFNFVDAGDYGSQTELDFLVLDYDEAKQAYGYGTFQLKTGPGFSTWVVNEKTSGLYADYTLNTDVSGHGLRANLGARYVHTKVEASGWATETIPVVEDNSYNNILPSANIAFDASEKLVLRAAASRALTRPSLSSLVPNKTYSDVNFTVSGGNSQLDPLKADAIDLAAEYYFTDKSVLAVGYFYKDIKSFISQQQTSEPLRREDYANVQSVYPEQPALLDPSLLWTYRVQTNVDGTTLGGIEVAYQQAFTFLPGALGNLGFTGNYAHVNAETETTRNNQTVKVPLTGLSKNSWNATLYYEVPSFGVRVSVNNRDDYVTNNQGSNGNVSEATSGFTQVDMSAFFRITDNVTLSFEGYNLTDQYERLYTTGDGSMNLVREYNHTGRQLFLGLRANF